jgi:energy coupling factor transporter S component ThiW
VFGALLSGVLYRVSKGKLLLAVLGEIIGTGIIGSIISYPIMKFLVGRGEIGLFYYTPMFLLATLMGGGAAYVILKSLSLSKVLTRIQQKLGAKIYEQTTRPNDLSDNGQTERESDI